MASPFLPYANSSILIKSTGTVTNTDGRMVAAEGEAYLIKAFLKRQQSNSTETGSTKIPSRSQIGEIMPGASGDSFLYRGYGLKYAQVAASFELGISSENNLNYQDLLSQPSWLMPGSLCLLRLGRNQAMVGLIETSSGVFGGEGVDEIIYKEISGIPLSITGGELQN